MKYFYLGKKENEKYLRMDWFGAYGKMDKVKGVVLHDSASGMNATAESVARATTHAMSIDDDSANYHNVIDDKGQCYSVIREDVRAYHTASKEGNYNYIGIEIAPSLTGGNFKGAEREKYHKAWKEACKLVADYCVKYKLTEKNVRQHNEFSSTACPYSMKMYFGSYEKALKETRKEVARNIKIIKGEKMEYNYAHVVEKVKTRFGSKHLVKFTGNAGIYRDKSLKKKDSARDFKKGDYQMATPLGWIGKYYVYSFVSNNGKTYYFRSATKK